MDPASCQSIRRDSRRQTLDGAVEGFLPNDPPFALVPVIAAAVVFLFLVTVGPRLPWICLAMLGPIGVAAISYAVATTPGAGDGAVLYTMPVLWTTFFYGRRGAAGILACVGVGHAVALLVLPSSSVYPGRWIDVLVSVSAAAVVVLALEGRNQSLLARLAAEARTDPLTGPLNRRGLEERAEVESPAHAGITPRWPWPASTLTTSSTSTTSGVTRPAIWCLSGWRGS